MIVGRGISYQQTLGSELAASGVEADDQAMYLTKSQICMVWTYDDRAGSSARTFGSSMMPSGSTSSSIRLMY